MSFLNIVIGYLLNSLKLYKVLSIWLLLLVQKAVHEPIVFILKNNQHDANSENIKPVTFIKFQLTPVCCGANMQINIMPRINSPKPSNWNFSEIIWKKGDRGLVMYWSNLPNLIMFWPNAHKLSEKIWSIAFGIKHNPYKNTMFSKVYPSIAVIAFIVKYKTAKFTALVTKKANMPMNESTL